MKRTIFEEVGTRHMGFIADGMLGRLTRWLRMLGCDVEYLNNASDDELLDATESEDKILLTRDLELYRRAKKRGLKSFFVDSSGNQENLAYVAQRFSISLDVDPSDSRCPTCNSSIRFVNKLEVMNRVSIRTLQTHDEFWECEKCRKIYWRGSHWKRINETLNGVQRILETLKP